MIEYITFEQHAIKRVFGAGKPIAFPHKHDVDICLVFYRGNQGIEPRPPQFAAGYGIILINMQQRPSLIISTLLEFDPLLQKTFFLPIR